MQYFIIFLFLFSCSSLRHHDDKSSHAGGKKHPLWINDTSQYCGEDKFCAVGEASDAAKGEARARDNLAKIFSTKVESRSTVKVSFEGGVHDSSRKSDEEYVSLIRESTELVLEGAVIEARFQDEESHFALASLEKHLGARILRNKIQGLDEQMEALYQTNRRSHLRKAIGLHKAREALEGRYLIFRSMATPPPVPLKVLMNKMLSLGTNRVIFVEGGRENDATLFEKALVQELVALGFKVASDENSQFDIKVRTTLDFEEQHLNVKGFKKFIVSFTMSSFNPKNQKQGQVVFEFEGNGRSRKDILYKVRDEMIKSIKEHTDKLNLDA